MQFDCCFPLVYLTIPPNVLNELGFRAGKILLSILKCLFLSSGRGEEFQANITVRRNVSFFFFYDDNPLTCGLANPGPAMRKGDREQRMRVEDRSIGSEEKRLGVSRRLHKWPNDTMAW